MFGADCDPIARQTVETGYGRGVVGMPVVQNMYITLQRCQKMSFLEGDVHVWLGCAAERGSDNKKAPVAGSFLNQNGGGGGMSKF